MFGNIVEKGEEQVENKTMFIGQKKNGVLKNQKATFVVILNGRTGMDRGGSTGRHTGGRDGGRQVFIDVEKEGRKFRGEKTFG